MAIKRDKTLKELASKNNKTSIQIYHMINEIST